MRRCGTHGYLQPDSHLGLHYGESYGIASKHFECMPFQYVEAHLLLAAAQQCTVGCLDVDSFVKPAQFYYLLAFPFSIVSVDATNHMSHLESLQRLQWWQLWQHNGWLQWWQFNGQLQDVNTTWEEDGSSLHTFHSEEGLSAGVSPECSGSHAQAAALAHGVDTSEMSTDQLDAHQIAAKPASRRERVRRYAAEAQAAALTHGVDTSHAGKKGLP